MRARRSRRWAPAFAGLVAAFAATGCALFGPESASVDPASAGDALGGLAGEAQRLLEADRAFAEKSAGSGAPEAFREFFADDGLQLSADGEPVIGPDGVRARLAARPAMVLSWEPRFAEVFAPGHWGWTWGDWQAHEPGAAGRRLGQGRYVNIWKKDADGNWKVRFDMGSVAGEKSP